MLLKRLLLVELLIEPGRHRVLRPRSERQRSRLPVRLLSVCLRPVRRIAVISMVRLCDPGISGGVLNVLLRIMMRGNLCDIGIDRGSRRRRLRRLLHCQRRMQGGSGHEGWLRGDRRIFRHSGRSDLKTILDIRHFDPGNTLNLFEHPGAHVRRSHLTDKANFSVQVRYGNVVSGKSFGKTCGNLLRRRLIGIRLRPDRREAKHRGH